MTKVSIKAKPTFVAPVDIPRAGENTLRLNLTFKHRTKKELAAFSQRDAENPREDLDVVMDMVDGWDAVEDFSRESVAELLENHHAAGDVIVEAYITELRKARSGN